jgi:3',5'-cyclic-AMP phosphodiesterase
VSDRPLRVLHVSDTHLLAAGTRHYGRVDTTAALRAVLDRAAALDHVDVVALSGDLSDDGSLDSYETLRDLVWPWAAARGAVVVPAMGNHDLAEAFTAVLGPAERVVGVRGWRVVSADTSVRGAGYGRLGDAGLTRLRAALAGELDPDGAAAPHGSVVVLHHPPVPARSALLGALELRDPDALLAACGPRVRAVLAGHYHHGLVAQPAGVPVVVAPGVANQSDPVAPAGRERATSASGFAVVDVPADGFPEVTFVAVGGDELFDLGPAEVARIAAAAGGA